MNRFPPGQVQAQAICDMRLIAHRGLNREKLRRNTTSWRRRSPGTRSCCPTGRSWWV